MKIIRRITIALTVVLTVLILEPTGWSQCAMCRTALENSVEGQAIAEGFRYGIVFLLAVPYAIIGSITFGVFTAFRKRPENQD